MKLDYGTQISPSHITLSIGTIKKPTLKDISELSFDKFGYYEMFIRMTPEIYYTKMCGEKGVEYWESLSEKKQDSLDMFEIIKTEKALADAYVEVLNFFFVEQVIFDEGYFIILKNDVEYSGALEKDNVKCAFLADTFKEILDILQQICGIAEEKPEEQKFKNDLARKLFEKMLKGKKKEKKVDKNFMLPNIISALCNRHPSINYTNVWDLTVFQLLDSFNRTQANLFYDIESTRVSVWGDEKKTFDASLWYKNNFDTR